MSDKAVSVELRSLNNLIMRYLTEHSNTQHDNKLTMPNTWIIGYIAKNSDRDVFQKDLEKEFCITRSTISKVINLMVKKGYIEQKSVPYDARLKKLVLTPRAEKISESMKNDGNKLNQQLIQGFSDEELSMLFSFIERMQNNLK